MNTPKLKRWLTFGVVTAVLGVCEGLYLRSSWHLEPTGWFKESTRRAISLIVTLGIIQLLYTYLFIGFRKDKRRR